jgi:hypothetical protein
LQVALTLALANPVLWYLIDRSLPGFAFSAVVSVAGTLALLLVDPDFVPVPAIHQQMASEQFGVYTWHQHLLRSYWQKTAVVNRKGCKSRNRIL